MQSVKIRHVAEWSISTARVYDNPFRELQVDAVLEGDDGSTITVPAFWRGDGVWSVRFSSERTGSYAWHIRCSDPDNRDFDVLSGVINVEQPDEAEANPLYAHGRLRESADKRYFVHADGTPAFWLSDNLSMCLSKRISDGELFALLDKRRQQGFTGIIVATGQFPDMMPFDDRSESLAGFPWDEAFRSVRPAYYDAADTRILRIVEEGLVPFIVGTWGHMIQFADEEMIRLHWRNLIARYAAYPVLFAAAGDGTMMIHGDARYTPEQNLPYRMVLINEDNRNAYGEKARQFWTDMTEYIHQTDPYHTPVSVTPTADGYPYPHYATDQVTKNVLDFEMIHDYVTDRLPARIAEARDREARLPIVGYLPSDSYFGTSATQSTLFWKFVLNGACGVLYWSTGTYFMNHTGSYYGPSGHGCTWSFETMEESLRGFGSEGISRCKELLMRYPWTGLVPHPEWLVGPDMEKWEQKDVMVANASASERMLAAGTSDGVRFFYIPANLTREIRASRKPRLNIGNRPVHMKAVVLSSMTEYDYGVAYPDQKGEWIAHKRHCFYQPVFGDFLLIAEPLESEPTEIPCAQDASELPQEDDALLLAICRR